MNNYNELRKKVRDAFVDDEKSGMFPTVDWVMNYLIAQGRILPDGYAMQLDDALDAVRYLLPLAKGYVATNPGIRSTECIIEDAEAMIAAAQKVGG